MGKVCEVCGNKISVGGEHIPIGIGSEKAYYWFCKKCKSNRNYILSGDRVEAPAAYFAELSNDVQNPILKEHLQNLTDTPKWFAKYTELFKGEAVYIGRNSPAVKELTELGFKPDKIFHGSYGTKETLLIDTVGRKIAICIKPKDSLSIIPFDNILECEIIENGGLVTQGGLDKGNAIRSFIGAGVIGLGISALAAPQKKSVNIVDSLQVWIGTSDIDNPVLLINVLSAKIERFGEQYKKASAKAHEIYATITGIISSNALQEQEENGRQDDIYAELEKLAKLKDKGIITETEFEMKKTELLERI